MTANQLIPILEGLVGSGLRAGRAPQRVALWLDCLKTVMRSQGLRDATDWNIIADADIVNAAQGTALDASGGTVYGVLVDSIFDVASEGLHVQCQNVTGTLTSETIDANAFATESGYLALRLPAASGATDAVFGTWLDPSGQVFPSAIFATADGTAAVGTAPTANDVRIYIVYRDTVEVQV